jgi:hypothetical protein
MLPMGGTRDYRSLQDTLVLFNCGTTSCPLALSKKSHQKPPAVSNMFGIIDICRNEDRGGALKTGAP